MTMTQQQKKKFSERLTDAMIFLCHDSLGGITRFKLNALIGITLEDGEVMLVTVDKTINDGTVFPETFDIKEHVEEPTSQENKGVSPGTGQEKIKKRKISHSDPLEKDRNENYNISSDVVLGKPVSENQNVSQSESVEDNLVGSEGITAQDAEKDPEQYTSILEQDNVKTGAEKIPHVGPYHCTECTTVYRYRKCIIEHYLKCHNKVPEHLTETQKYNCAQCDRGFSSKLSLTRHLVTHDNCRPRHQCSNCMKTFTSKRHAEFHINTIHKGQYPFVCDLCGKNVTTKSALESHMASKHSVNKLKCHKCNREYGRTSTLAAHTCLEKTPKRTICKVCDKTFVQPKQLVQHMAKHKDPRYQCEQCGRNYKWMSSLQAHKLAAHSDELLEQKHLQNVEPSIDKKHQADLSPFIPVVEYVSPSFWPVQNFEV